MLRSKLSARRVDPLARGFAPAPGAPGGIVRQSAIPLGCPPERAPARLEKGIKMDYELARKAAEFYSRSPDGQYDEQAEQALTVAYGTLYEVRYVTSAGAAGSTRMQLAKIPIWLTARPGTLIVQIAPLFPM